MNLSQRTSTVIVAAAAILCIAGNLLVAWNRSTIPRSIDAEVAAKEIGREKHPGQDDVYFLTFDDKTTTHVDRFLFDAVEPGDRVRKDPFSSEVAIDGRQSVIPLSEDLEGLMPTMVVALVVVGLLLIVSWRRDDLV